MWVINDVWSRLAMNIAWPRWHGKNLSVLGELGARWEIAETHIVRSSAYKGENQVACLPGFRYDALTTLGLFQTLGALAQVRGLAGTTQLKIVGLLREVLEYSIWPNGLSLLPETILTVEDCQASMKEWLLTLPRSEKAAIKTRSGGSSKEIEILWQVIIVGAGDRWSCGRFRLVFFAHMTYELCIKLAMFFTTHDMELSACPTGRNFLSFFDKWRWKFRDEKNLEISRKSIWRPFVIHVERCFEFVLKSGVGRVWEGSKWSIGRSLGCPCRGGKGLGRVKTNHAKGFGLFRVPKRGMGKVREGSKWSMGRVWAAHAFQEREGFWKGQTFKTNYGKLFLFFMVP